MTARLSTGLRHTLLYGVSIAFMKSISLIMLPFIAHHLSTNEFGRLEVIASLAAIGSILVGMGLEDTLFRFAGSVKDTQKQKQLAAEIFGLTLVIGSIAAIAAWLSANQIANWIPGNPSIYEVRLVLFMLAMEGCIAIPLAWLRMRNQATTFFLMTTARALLQALLVIFFTMADRGVAGILEAGLIAALTQALALTYLQVRDTGIQLSYKTGHQSFIYSLPIVASGLVAFTLNGFDRWILAEYTSMVEVAHFGVASKFALAVILLIQPFGMWWSPRRFKVLNEPDGKTKVAYFSALGITLILIIAVLVGLISPVLINWLLPDTYAIAARYAIGLVLVMALKEMVELLNIGCFIGKTTGSQLLINCLAAIVGVMVMFYLAPIYAVWGIILALLVAQSIRLILFFIASQHFLPLPYPFRSLLILTTIGTGCLFISTLADNPIHQLLISSTGSILLVVWAFSSRLLPPSMPRS